MTVHPGAHAGPCVGREAAAVGRRLPRRAVLRAGTVAAASAASLAVGSWASATRAGADEEEGSAGEDGLAGAIARPPAPAVPDPEVGAARVVIPTPAIVTRAQWGADETIRSPVISFAPIRKLIVHHSATAVDDDPSVTIRAIYRFHVEQNGWNDIAYNFLIDPAGRVYEGRWARTYAPGEVPTGEDLFGRGVVGAHTLDHNTGSCGVCVLGNYVDDPPPAVAVRSLVQVLAWEAARHDIDPLGADPYTGVDGVTSVFANVAGHRELVPTACPGGAFFAQFPALKARVAARLRASVLGYRILRTDGTVARFGDVADAGDPAGAGLRPPFGGVAAAALRDGYWVFTADGGVLSFGDAGFHGSLPGVGVRARVVDQASTPTGAGYWLLGADGAVFSFGDAAFCGSLPGLGLDVPVRKLRATPSGLGYWILGADGGVFTFGDAPFFGSPAGVGVTTSVVDLWPTPSGRGYWVLGLDGGVFAFGDALFAGSLGGLAALVGVRPQAFVGTPTGAGYWILGADGGVFSFGDAPFFGSTGGVGAPALGLAVAAQP